MTLDKLQPRYAAPAAAAGAEILLTLAHSSEPLPVAELAMRTGRTRSLVYRVLAELASRRFVVKTSEGYSLGVASVELGGAFLTSVPLLASIRAVLRRLADITSETANLAVPQADQVLYLLREEGELSAVAVSRLGKLLPANATAVGKALLAQMTEGEIEQIFASRLASHGRLSLLTPRTITSIGDLLLDVRRIRAQGFAEEIGETVVGRCCLAVNVPFGERGIESAAVGVSMAEHRFYQMRDEVLAELFKAKEDIEREVHARVAMGQAPSADEGPA